MDGANWTYTPAENFTGEDQLTFVVNDGLLDSEPATVTLTVDSVNDVPEILSMELPTRVAAGFPVVLRTEYQDDGAVEGGEYTAVTLWGAVGAMDTNGEFVDPDDDGPQPPRLVGLQVDEPVGEKRNRESTEFGKGTVFGEHTYTEPGRTYEVTQCLTDGGVQICESESLTVERLVNLTVSLLSEEEVATSGFIDLDLMVTNQQPEGGVAGLAAQNVTLWQVTGLRL